MQTVPKRRVIKVDCLSFLIVQALTWSIFLQVYLFWVIAPSGAKLMDTGFAVLNLAVVGSVAFFCSVELPINARKARP